MHRAYVRVSTEEQNEERQIEGLQKHGIDKWYVEKISGKNAEDREQFQLLLSEAKEGDTIFVHDFSRFARSTVDLLTITDDLTKRGIHLVSNKENLDTSTPTGRLLLTMIAAINEFERTNMLERQREGIAIAKRNGSYKNCGRKHKEIDRDHFQLVYDRLRNKEIAKIAAAKELGVTRPTLDRMLERESA